MSEMRIVISLKKSRGVNYFFEKFLTDVWGIVENNFDTFERVNRLIKK